MLPEMLRGLQDLNQLGAASRPLAASSAAALALHPGPLRSSSTQQGRWHLMIPL